MVIENQENRVRTVPLTFTVPACCFVVAVGTEQFRLTERASEWVGFLRLRWPVVGLSPLLPSECHL